MQTVRDFANKYFYEIIIAAFILIINAALLTENNVIIVSCVLLATLTLLFFNKKVFLGIVVFLIPLSIVMETGMGPAISFPSEFLAAALFLYMFTKTILGPGFNKKILYHPITLIILLDISWLVLSSFTSSMPLVSFKRVLIRVIYYGVYYFFAIEVFKNHQWIKKIFFLYMLGLVYPIIKSIVFHSHFNFSITGSYKMMLPFYNDHTIYGACIAFLLPLLFYIIKESSSTVKPWFILLFIFLVIAEILSYSRASWISLMLIFFLYMGTRIKIKLHSILVIIFAISVIVFFSFENIVGKLRQNESVSNKDVGQHLESISNIETDASNTERLNRWYCAVKMFMDKPIFGYGPGTYQFEYGRYQVKSNMTRISTFKGEKGTAHSEYLNYLSETGLPGLLIFLALVLASMQTGLRQIYDPTNEYRDYSMALLLSLCTFFIHAFFNSFLDIDKMAMLVFTAIAGLVAIDVWKLKRVEKKS